MRPGRLVSSVIAGVAMLMVAAPAGALTSGAAGARPAAGAPVTFTVNSTLDAADKTIDGVCQTATVGQCTLRAAIQEANAATGPVTIAFAIAGTGVHTIAPATTLPTLNNTSYGITIDGFTQSGSSPNADALVDKAVRTIELKGKGPSGPSGLIVTSSNNTIRGLDMHGFFQAINITGTAATHNTVIGNLLGLTPTGALDPTYQDYSNASCVVLQQGAQYNQIGSPGSANRNVISGCDFKGIATYNYPTNWNVIQNNIIGLDPTGTQRRATQSHGIDVTRGSEHTMIGGTGPQQGNLVSGNGQAGIEVAHMPASQYNSVIGNLVGTDPTGNSAPAYAANGYWGIHLEGKGDCGTQPCTPDQSHATVEYNVVVDNGNANQGGGIMVDKGTHDSLIAYNKVGITANGTPAGNKHFGININGGAFKDTVSNNVVAYNEAGVQIEPDQVLDQNHVLTTTNQNTITQNSIYSNGVNGVPALGIDLTPFGKVNTAANASTYVNDAMIAPVLSGVTPTNVNAKTCASCTVEFFVADSPAGQTGSGKTYLGSATADGTGVAHFYVPAAGRGQPMTATATNTNGSTSEFSKNVAIPLSTPGDVAPTAHIVASCVQLSCSFDGSTSTDSDGTIVQYQWAFGDGASATGAKVNHTYASAGTYTAQLTVTDNGGLSNATTSQNTVAITSGVVAYDTFARTQSGGWGTADEGGAYTLNGTAADYSVASGKGLIHIGTASTSHYANLGGVSVLNSDAVVDVGTDVTPAGGAWGQVSYLTARHVATNTEYRVRLRFPVGGGVKLSFVKVVGSTTEVQIGSEVTIAGLTYTPGAMYRVRFDVSGTNPTTLQARVWAVGTTEPASWNLAVTDSEASLQVAGNPGVRVNLGGSATAFPTFSLANYQVRDLG